MIRATLAIAAALLVVAAETGALERDIGTYHSFGERGPGVAILLALAAELQRIAPCDSIALVATSGHE